MNTNNSSKFDDFVRQEFTVDVPPHVEESLQQQLREFRDSVGNKVEVSRERKRSSRAAAWIVSVSAAALLLLVFAYITSSTTPSWADVVEAVRQQPWIHCADTSRENGQHQFWYGMERGVVASSADDLLYYCDRELGIEHRYVPAEETVYRLPASDRSILPTIDALLRTFSRRALVASLPGRQGAHLAEQSVRTVTEDDRQWLDFIFQFEPSPSTRYSWEFRVDRDTSRPKYWTRRFADGTVQVLEMSYPTNGPASVYGLGAPKQARLVDRVPSADLDRILSGLKRACDGVAAEPYVAFIVERAPRGEWTDALQIYRMWRSGSKWRVERAFFPDVELMRDRIHSNSVPHLVDSEARLNWWKEQLSRVRFEPLFVSDGRHGVLFRTRTLPEVISTPAELKNATFVVDSKTPVVVDPDDVNPMARFAFQLPEPAAFMAVGRPTAERTIELQHFPEMGPADTVLVVRRDSRTMQNCRVWVDPSTFLGMRWELEDAAGAPSRLGGMISIGVVEEVSRSPQRLPYVSRYRQGTARDAGVEELRQDHVVDVYRDYSEVISPPTFSLSSEELP